MRVVAWLALICLIALMPACAPVSSPTPDVVIVTWDTVRADHVGTCGAKDSGLIERSTPNWDRLAATGVTFSEARSPVPITLPAHTSLFTGLFPSSHGVRHNGTFFAEPALRTLAERFKEAQYTTAAFVSAQVLDPRYGLDQGFDTYDAQISKRPGQHTVASRRGDETVERAITWVEGIDPKRPIFLWVHLYDPHRLWRAPEAFSKKLSPYPAEIAFADHQTGLLMESLERIGRRERTILVATSDHGESLGEHGEATHAYFAYDSTLRVPMMIWAGAESGVTLKTGACVPGPASLVDVAPTLLELAGLEAQAVDGRSLEPQLRGEPVPPRLHPLESVATALDYGTAPVFGLLRQDGHTYYDVPRREHYDLAMDPGQERNLEPEAASADENFGGWNWNWPPADGAPTMTVNAGERAQLEALGYVAGSAPASTSDFSKLDPKDLIEVATFTSLDAELVTPERSLQLAAELEKRHGRVLALDRFRIKTLQKLGRPEDAAEVLAELVHRHPQDPGLQSELAAHHRNRDEQQKLATAIRAALRESPDHPSAERDLALVLHRLQNLEEATQLYRKVLAKHPEMDDIRKNLGRALVAQGLHLEALEAIEIARKRDEHDVDLDCLAGRLMAHYANQQEQARPLLAACQAAGRPLDSIDQMILDAG
jgi:arylsulfatase A-like enzyme